MPVSGVRHNGAPPPGDASASAAAAPPHPDLLLPILAHLGAAELLEARRVCRLWAAVAGHPALVAPLLRPLLHGAVPPAAGAAPQGELPRLIAHLRLAGSLRRGRCRHDVRRGPGLRWLGVGLPAAGPPLGLTDDPDQVLRLAHPLSGRRLRALAGYPVAVDWAAFTGDGAAVATGSRRGALALWRAADGTLAQPLAGHADSVSHLAFTADAATLVSASYDATVRLWDVPAGSLRQLLPHGSPVAALGLHPAGRVLASGEEGGAVRLWDLASRRSHLLPRSCGVAGVAPFLCALAFAADGDVLFGGDPYGTLWRWDLRGGGAPQAAAADNWPVVGLAPHPGGRVLASGHGNGWTRLWAADSLAPIGPLGDQDHGPVDLAGFAADGTSLVAFGRSEGSCHTYDFLEALPSL